MKTSTQEIEEVKLSSSLDDVQKNCGNIGLIVVGWVVWWIICYNFAKHCGIDVYDHKVRHALEFIVSLSFLQTLHSACTIFCALAPRRADRMWYYFCNICGWFFLLGIVVIVIAGVIYVFCKRVMRVFLFLLLTNMCVVAFGQDYGVIYYNDAGQPYYHHRQGMTKKEHEMMDRRLKAEQNRIRREGFNPAFGNDYVYDEGEAAWRHQDVMLGGNRAPLFEDFDSAGNKGNAGNAINNQGVFRQQNAFGGNNRRVMSPKEHQMYRDKVKRSIKEGPTTQLYKEQKRKMEEKYRKRRF